MPLDVSMVLADPMLSDSFSVRRESESVGSNGRTTTVGELIEGLTGIITPEEPADLQRRDDGQLVPHNISIITSFSLRDASFGYQPDVVIWGGTEYLVKKVLSFQRVSGHTQALATSTRATDRPPA